MSMLSRREFQQQTLGSLMTWSLLNTLFTADAFADDVKLVATKWLTELKTMSRDLRGDKLGPVAWQKQVEDLFAKVDLPEMLKFVDFDKLTRDVKLPASGEMSLRATLPKVEGLPTDLVFGHQVFALGKGRSIVPHGHDNMSTAFLILQGEFQGRHFDRLEDDDKHMIIKPTLDKTFGVGGCSTVSDFKDNVHWFKSNSDRSFIFNIHVISANAGPSGRVYVDPDGEKLSGGRIKARKIDHTEANKLYG